MRGVPTHGLPELLDEGRAEPTAIAADVARDETIDARDACAARVDDERLARAKPADPTDGRGPVTHAREPHDEVHEVRIIESARHVRTSQHRKDPGGDDGRAGVRPVGERPGRRRGARRDDLPGLGVMDHEAKASRQVPRAAGSEATVGIGHCPASVPESMFDSAITVSWPLRNREQRSLAAR